MGSPARLTGIKSPFLFRFSEEFPLLWLILLKPADVNLPSLHLALLALDMALHDSFQFFSSDRNSAHKHVQRKIEPPISHGGRAYKTAETIDTDTSGLGKNIGLYDLMGLQVYII